MRDLKRCELFNRRLTIKFIIDQRILYCMAIVLGISIKLLQKLKTIKNSLNKMRMNEIFSQLKKELKRNYI